jgi:AraC family transcriptional regulator
VDYRIVEKPSFKVAGKSIRVPTKDGDNFRVIPEFWTECRENRYLETLIDHEPGDRVIGDGILGICLDFADDMSEFTYIIGAETTAVLKTTHIPASTWAVFESVGPLPEAIQRVWSYVMDEFFAVAPYKHGHAPEIEFYPGGDSRTLDFRCEVWIPVLPK